MWNFQIQPSLALAILRPVLICMTSKLICCFLNWEPIRLSLRRYSSIEMKERYKYKWVWERDVGNLLKADDYL